MSTVASEWIKLWTTRTVWWSLVAALVLMLAGSGQYALYATHGDLEPSLLDNGKVAGGTIAMLALSFAQLAFLALAMLVMTSEFSTGTIRSTLAWTPSRGRLLLAKSAVVAAVTFVAGAVAGLLGGLAAVPLLGDTGKTPAGGLIADAVTIGVYLALLAVLATGLGAAMRGPVISLVVVLMLVVVVPPILQGPELPVLDAIADGMPGVAGGHFLHGDTDPYPAAVGLLILVAWTVAAGVAGWLSLRRRDA